MKTFWLALVAFTLVPEAFSAKRDLKNLFGSYQGEKFQENELQENELGFDISLTTLLPITPLVSISEPAASAAVPSNYSAFFNVEASLFYTLSYRWVLFVSGGYYTYSSRRENQILTGATPRFTDLSLTLFPVMGGIKYRFGDSDFVPYVGVAGGVALGSRRATYDYDTSADIVGITAPCGEALAGVEFYISARSGVRLEVSGMLFMMPSGIYNPNPGAVPAFNYQAMPISVRYASGIFFLF